MRSRESTRAPWRRSRGVGGRYAAGRRSTTTSAASASSAGAVRLATRGGTARQQVFGERRRRRGHPADVAAIGAARILADGAAGPGLGVDDAALEAADAFDARELRTNVSRC